MGDWADGKAREWLNEHSDAWHSIFVGNDEAPASLAALLREVVAESEAKAIGEFNRGRMDTLAEVRRVIQDEWAQASYGDGLELKLVAETCERVLSRLDKL